MSNENGSVPNQDEGLRSQNSRFQSFVRFVNKTKRKVDVIWINYEGQRVKYETLSPDEYYDINTFVSHPWIFRDSISQAKLMASCQDVFQPRPWFHGFNSMDPRSRQPVGPIIPRRTIICITLPVYTLKERCLEVVRQLIRPEDVSSLEIPRDLQCELSNP